LKQHIFPCKIEDVSEEVGQGAHVEPKQVRASKVRPDHHSLASGPDVKDQFLDIIEPDILVLYEFLDRNVDIHVKVPVYSPCEEIHIRISKDFLY